MNTIKEKFLRIISFLEPIRKWYVLRNKKSREGLPGNPGPQGSVGFWNQYNTDELTSETLESWFKVEEVCYFCQTLYPRDKQYYIIELLPPLIRFDPFHPIRAKYQYTNNDKIRVHCCFQCSNICKYFIDDIKDRKEKYNRDYNPVNSVIMELSQYLPIELVNIFFEYYNYYEYWVKKTEYELSDF